LSYTPPQYPIGKAGKLDYPSIRVNLFGLKKSDPGHRRQGGGGGEPL